MLLVITFRDGTQLSLRADANSIEVDGRAVSGADDGPDTSFDPRAFRPRCVHGLLFSDPCDVCDAAVIPAHAPPSGVPSVVGTNDESDLQSGLTFGGL